MSFWKRMNIRWDKESISTWSSPRKTLYILFPLLLYFLVHDMAEVLLWAGLNLFMGRASESVVGFLNQNAYSVRGIIYGIAILIGVAAIGQGVLAEIYDRPKLVYMDEKPKKKKLPLFGQEAGKQIKKYLLIKEYLLLAALAFLSSFGLNLLFSLIGFTESSQAFSDTARAQFGVDFLIGLVLYGILSPVAEEAVFRGLIYNRMKRCFRFEIALIVSALLFGLYHGNLVQAVYGTILGLLIAYMYELHHSFAVPVLFHAIANVSIYVMTYYQIFADIDRNVGMAVSIVSLLGAVACILYIRKCAKNADNKNGRRKKYAESAK